MLLSLFKDLRTVRPFMMQPQITIMSSNLAPHLRIIQKITANGACMEIMVLM